MSNDLCEELIVEIFSRLPSKSLLRLRSVSKSLCSYISSPDFIRLHALRSPKKVMITHTTNYRGGFNARRMYTLHSEGQLMLDNPYIGVTPVQYPFSTSTDIVVGSCNGIVCVDNTLKRRT
ncbi:putative F-box domain-containing protein [Helianthus anomalus]